jgi:hypothetical protein
VICCKNLSELLHSVEAIPISARRPVASGQPTAPRRLVELHLARRNSPNACTPSGAPGSEGYISVQDRTRYLTTVHGGRLPLVFRGALDVTHMLV